jgi:hypothetical protein
MIDQDKERFRQLCESASKEQDSKKLAKLIEEINRAIDRPPIGSPLPTAKNP